MKHDGFTTTMLKAIGLAVPMICLPARADFVFRATFYEQHYFDSSGDPGENISTGDDGQTDLWSLAVTSQTGEVFPFQITKVTITLPTTPANVMYDIATGGPGKSNGYAFAPVSAVSVLNPAAVEVDGSKVLELDFTGKGFDALNDRFVYGIDVDNSNACLRGYNVSPSSNGAIGGNSYLGADQVVHLGNPIYSARLDVEYLTSGGYRTASAYFMGDGTGVEGQTKSLAHRAVAEVTLVPAPGAVVLGMIGFGLVGWVKRRFA